MQMIFYAGCNCVFLISSWTTNSDQCHKFAGFLGLTLLLTLLTDVILASKNEVRKASTRHRSNRKLVFALLFLQVVWCFNNVMLMLLAMSYNWWVILTIAGGKLLGYFLCTSHIKSKHQCC